MKTLSEYILAQKTIDHCMRATVHSPGVITLLIHPQGVDGDTLDFLLIQGNLLIPLVDEKTGSILSPEEALSRYMDGDS